MEPRLAVPSHTMMTAVARGPTETLIFGSRSPRPGDARFPPRRRLARALLAAAAAGLCLFAVGARAEPLPSASAPPAPRELSSTPDGATAPLTLALILGVNKSVDSGLPVLRYADDDAVRYHELFRVLGARTYLLTRLDENTQRLAADVTGTPSLPRRLELQEAVATLGLEVAAAHARGQRVVFYFVYAGHGNVDGAMAAANDQGYLALEDGRLTATEIEKAVIDRIGADESHLIVDACYSYFLAYGRGPGGRLRELHGFVPSVGLAQRPDVGLLLSTTSARQSHEWEGFQAGVFSHEVRSGLFGAADFDGDGRISYREMAAFVGRANAAISNEKFRPTIFSHPPKNNADLLDLRRRATRALLLDSEAPVAHYLLEDTRGVRVADFHNAPGHRMTLLLPSSGVLYLRRLSDDRELTIGEGERDVNLTELRPSAPRVAVRGAAHDAFNLIFSLPFDENAWRLSEASTTLTALEPGGTDADAGALSESLLASRATEPGPLLSRENERRAGWAALAIGGASTAFGMAMALAAWEADAQAHDPGSSQVIVARGNDHLASRERWAIGGFSLAAVSLAGGGLLLWHTRHDVQVTATVAGISGSFALVGRF